MPVIYYTHYDPEGLSIPEAAALEHRLGRALLAKGLQERYALTYTPEVLESALTVIEDHKPYLTRHPDICFSITHCSGLAACAFSSYPVGVDAEKCGYFAQVLINKTLTENEKLILDENSVSAESRQELFWRLWTLKEAYVKCRGTGMSEDLRSFSFSFKEAPLCSDPTVSCFQAMTASGHIISACFNGPHEKTSMIYRQITL